MGLVERWLSNGSHPQSKWPATSATFATIGVSDCNPLTDSATNICDTAATPCDSDISRLGASQAVANSLRQQDPQKHSVFASMSRVSQMSQASATDDPEERAALIEYSASVPRQWAEGYAALSTMPPPASFSSERWQRIVDGAGRFMDRWAVKAAECGWSDLNVFGANPDQPDRRFDCMGLLLLLDRCEIVGVDESGADLVAAPGGAEQRYRRRPLPAHTKPLWELQS